MGMEPPEIEDVGRIRARQREEAVKVTVGRIYRFRAIHSLPDFPQPWCFPHQHDYTVEVSAPGGTDTARLDERWGVAGRLDGKDLNEVFLFYPTTVENIAKSLLRDFPDAVSVTVWEDEQRWGKAER